ncbi:MAG TPA: ABC transporter substrate-binding protein, partial [Burkholderiales bacterium]|nr:ABC transporter substrate-binding protein [Burkholderiales bacterium]
MIRPLVLALAAALCVPFISPVGAQTTLTYSSWVSPQHHLSVWQANWTAEVEKATGGRVKFQSLPKHPSAPPGTFDAVRDGLMDLSYVTASYTPVRHVMPLMPELPGAGDTSVVNSIAYSRMHWKHFHKLGEYKGVKLLAVFT